MDRGKMSNLYRGPSIDASYQVSVHMGEGFRGEDCLWRPCLLMDWDGMSNLYRGLSIDASYQVSDRFAKRFQRRRFSEIDQSETRIACGGHVC
jgi:hypothetical protein